MARRKQRPKRAQDRPLLSLALIARNAAATLGPLLDSMAGVADETVLVDTGSTDGTVELARARGCRVYVHPWEHSFSKARNQAAGYCTGQWVMWMDADETLDPRHRDAVRPLLDADRHQLVFCKAVVNGTYQLAEYEVEGYGQATVVDKPRAWVNHRGIRWIYRVHENPHVPPGVVQTATFTPVNILHHGSMDGSKADYYSALLYLDFREDPKDWHAAMYLGAISVVRQDWDKALELLEAVDISRFPSGDPQIVARYHFLVGQAWQGKASTQAPDHNTREQWYANALDHYSDAKCSMARLQAAIIHLVRGRREFAVQILDLSLQVDPDHLLLSGLRRIIGALTHGGDAARAMSEYFQMMAGGASPREAMEAILAKVVEVPDPVELKGTPLDRQLGRVLAIRTDVQDAQYEPMGEEHGQERRSNGRPVPVA